MLLLADYLVLSEKYSNFVVQSIKLSAIFFLKD